MRYKDCEIRKVIVRIELWELDNEGNEIEVSDEKSTFAGYTAEKDIQRVEVTQDVDTFYVDGGDQTIEAMQRNIDEIIAENSEVK